MSEWRFGDGGVCFPILMGFTSFLACHMTSLPQLYKLNCVRRSIDVAGFWELMHAALDAADAASPVNHPDAELMLTAAVL